MKLSHIAIFTTILLPGLGHIILKEFWRGIIFFLLFAGACFWAFFNLMEVFMIEPFRLKHYWMIPLVWLAALLDTIFLSKKVR